MNQLPKAIKLGHETTGSQAAAIARGTLDGRPGLGPLLQNAAVDFHDLGNHRAKIGQQLLGLALGLGVIQSINIRQQRAEW